MMTRISHQIPPVITPRKRSKSRFRNPYFLLVRVITFSFQENLIISSGEPCDDDRGLFRFEPKPFLEYDFGIYTGWCVNMFGMDNLIGVRPNEFVNVTVHGLRPFEK
jgi:hypothetical protein